MGIFFILFVLLDIFNNANTLKSLKPFLLGAVMLLGIGTGFKVLHWAGANQLLLFSVLAITIIYIIQLTMLKARGFEEYVKTFFVIILGLTSLTTVLHWPGKEILTVVALIFFVLYFGLLIYKYFSQKKQKSNSGPDNENNQ
jgi:hypothetical protein